METGKKIERAYIIAIIFSALYVIGSSYKIYLNGDEVEYVSLAKSFIQGLGFRLYDSPSTIASTWSFLISPIWIQGIDLRTSIIISRILSLLLIIFSLFQITYILKNIVINDQKLSEGNIYLIQIIIFSNLYFWRETGSLFLEPFSLFILLFIIIILVKEKYDLQNLILLGILSAVLVATKYITLIIFPALMLHFWYRSGLTKTFVLRTSVVLFTSFILLMPVGMRFINIEFFNNMGNDFSYLERYNIDETGGTSGTSVFTEIKSGLFNFINKFHEYFTTISKLNAPYFSIIFLLPLLLFFYRQMKSGFILSFYCSFPILYILAFIASGVGGNTRYWIIIFPLLIIFTVYEVSGWRFLKKEVSIPVKNTYIKIISTLISVLILLIIVTAIYARFINENLPIKIFTLGLSILFVITLFIYLSFKMKKFEVYKLVLILLTIVPASRALNEFIILGRPAPKEEIARINDQLELCKFLDSKKWEYPVFQNTDTRNAAWTTAYSDQNIKDILIFYKEPEINNIYLISTMKSQFENIKLSNQIYNITSSSTIFTNLTYKIQQLSLEKNK